MRSYVNLLAGDPAPWFHQRTAGNPRYAFDTAAGRYILLCFYGTAGDRRGQEALRAVATKRALFDDLKISFFGVSLDKEDEKKTRVTENIPGVRFIWDFDGSVSKLYGAMPVDSDVEKEKVPLRRLWVVLDPTLRVIKILPFSKDNSCASEVLSFLEQLPPVPSFAGFEVPAPILVLPNVFEEDLPGASRQHNARHRAPALRGIDQPQRRVRGRRNRLSRIRTQAIQTAAGRRCRIFLLTAACCVEGEVGAALRLPAVPVRRCRRQNPRSKRQVPQRGRWL